MARPHTKADILEKLKSIPDDEPLFLLRAQDKTAPKLIQQWIENNIQRLTPQNPKILSAHSAWYAFCAWVRRKDPD